jgi:glycerol kinase
MNTGGTPVRSNKGLITTMAVAGDGRPCYALEGSVFIAGAAIQWLRDELKILASSGESNAMARSLDSNDGVYLVPAFAGLGAPHWDMDARGTLVGMTRGTGRAHLVRAALEAMAYQSYDVLMTMEEETGQRLPELAVDGGAAANDFLMQFQADLIQRPVIRPAMLEATSAGAAFLAGLNAGVWQDAGALKAGRPVDTTFVPAMDDTVRDDCLAGWKKALRQAMQR